jgi:HSP20 family protein
MFGSRWTPFNNPVWNQLNQLQSEVNRLIDRWGEGGRPFTSAIEFPPLNLWEEDDAFYLEAELPGLALEDLEIFVTGHNQLTIKGQRKAPTVDKGVQHRQERGFGEFSRTLTLPMDINEEKVEARLEHGVLKVRLPKSEAAKPHKIQIKS